MHCCVGHTAWEYLLAPHMWWAFEHFRVPRRIICWQIFQWYNFTILYKYKKVKAEATVKRINKKNDWKQQRCTICNLLRHKTNQGVWKTRQLQIEKGKEVYKSKVFLSCRHKIVPESAWKIVWVRTSFQSSETSKNLLSDFWHLARMTCIACVSMHPNAR